MGNLLKKSIASLMMLLISTNLISQESKRGIHQMQSLEMRKDMIIPISKNHSDTPIIPLQVNSTKELNKVVFGFLPDWEYNSGAHNNMQYNLLTHIAVFDFTIQANGSINNPSNWPWTNVINGAHLEGTKVIMCISNFEVSDAALSTILRGTTQKNNFFKNVKNIISTYNLDGVNIDFEAFNTADRGSVINTFMSELTNYIHTQLPGKEVSFDGPAVNWNGWDFGGLVDAVDHLFIMAYDYNSNKSTKADPVSPLYPGSWDMCVDVTITSSSTGYAAAVNKSPEKIILGVPYYGQRWQTVNGDKYASVVAYDRSTRYKDDFDKFNTYGRQWDTDSHTSWYKYQSGGKWYEVYSDDAGSLSEKYDYSIAKNLGGVGIWALNFDGTKDELWNLISDKFSKTESNCKMSATSTSDFFVRYVKVMDETKTNTLLLNETVEDGGYGNYKNLSFNVDAGTSYQVMVRGKLYGTANSYWKLLADFDKDGAFDGENETLLSKEGDAWGYSSISIPQNANIITGTYTFRVAMSSTPFSTLCGSFTGEFEDYTMHVKNSLGLEDELGFKNRVSIYPNPTTGMVNIKLENKGEIGSVQIINTQSQIIFSAEGNIEDIDISNQKSGIYFVKVNFENGYSKVLKLIKR